MCFGCSKELSHRDGSFEYPQHMFWMRNKENNFPIRTLIWRPDTVPLSEYPRIFASFHPSIFKPIVIYPTLPQGLALIMLIAIKYPPELLLPIMK